MILALKSEEGGTNLSFNKKIKKLLFQFLDFPVIKNVRKVS